MSDPRHPNQLKAGTRIRVQRLVSPRLSDVLATIKDHPWVRTCKVCGKDCSREAVTKLVYAYEGCDCKAAPYQHLVENIYHATCFVKRAKAKSLPAAVPAGRQGRQADR